MTRQIKTEFIDSDRLKIPLHNKFQHNIIFNRPASTLSIYKHVLRQLGNKGPSNLFRPVNTLHTLRLDFQVNAQYIVRRHCTALP